MYREPIKEKRHYNFLFSNGGLGDLIAQLPAMKYILENHSQVIAHMWIGDFMVDLCKKALPYPNAIIRGLSEGKRKYKNDFLSRSPASIHIDNLSMHMTDHGFFTLAHRSPSNAERNYIKLPPIDISRFKLPSLYAVITTGYTSETRRWLPESINEVSDYLLGKGIIPVYLGKTYAPTSEDKGIVGTFEADYTKGINLIDKTNILEAHSIMANSKVVLGLDNGLLHVAAMSNVPIVYGFTSVIPEHRLPYRNDEMGHNCYVVKPKDLECFGCQSNMIFTLDFDFKNCFYKDYRCINELTSDLFIEQLQKILIEKPEREEKYYD